MIITKTPFRVSLMGGGTDLRAFYRHGYGAVVTSSIDQYVYLAIHRFFEPRIVLKYSQTESVDCASQIKHPLIRECLNICNVDQPMELTSFADIPSSGSGLGSSSAFSVGLIKALHCFTGGDVSAEKCASMACDVEIERLKEPIGKQDQYAVAYGGFNYVRFNADESVTVDPVLLPRARREELEGSLLMFYTGVTRSARAILSEQQKNTETDGRKVAQLQRMLGMADTLRAELTSGNVQVVGEMLHEAWMVKKQLASNISSGPLDEIYLAARAAGATGGKILGAGGGGFFLLHCRPEKQADVKAALCSLRHIPFHFDPQGTRTIYYHE